MVSRSNGKEIEYDRDRIEITGVSGIRIMAKDIDAKGTYSINGRYNAGRIISFIYEFEGNINLLTGGGVLELDPLMNECEGRWHGYVKEGKIIGGRLHWKHL